MLPTHIQQDGGDPRKNCIEPGVLSLHGSPLPVGRNEKKNCSRDVHAPTKGGLLSVCCRRPSTGDYGDVLSQLTSQFGRCLDHRHGEIVSLWTKFATRNREYGCLVREIIHLGRHVCKIAVPQGVHS